VDGWDGFWGVLFLPWNKRKRPSERDIWGTHMSAHCPARHIPAREKVESLVSSESYQDRTQDRLPEGGNREEVASHRTKWGDVETAWERQGIYKDVLDKNIIRYRTRGNFAGRGQGEG